MSSDISQEYRGGMWAETLHATWPFGRLRLETNGVSARIQILRRASWEATFEWDAMISVEPVRHIVLPFRGVRFSARQGISGLRMTFWPAPGHAERLVREVEAHVPDRIARPKRIFLP
jgi:hypothetical protein